MFLQKPKSFVRLFPIFKIRKVFHVFGLVSHCLDYILFLNKFIVPNFKNKYKVEVLYIYKRVLEPTHYQIFMHTTSLKHGSKKCIFI